MKKPWLILALLFLPAMLTACSYALDTTLFNNSGSAILVNWASGNAIVAQSRSGRLSFANVPRGVRISSGGCDYQYEVSPELDDYQADETLKRGIQIQVEKDFSVDLLPGSYAGNDPAPDNVILNHAGFPLRPVTKKCQPPS